MDEAKNIPIEAQVMLEKLFNAGKELQAEIDEKTADAKDTRERALVEESNANEIIAAKEAELKTINEQSERYLGFLKLIKESGQDSIAKALEVAGSSFDVDVEISRQETNIPKELETIKTEIAEAKKQLKKAISEIKESDLTTKESDVREKEIERHQKFFNAIIERALDEELNKDLNKSEIFNCLSAFKYEDGRPYFPENDYEQFAQLIMFNRYLKLYVENNRQDNKKEISEVIADAYSAPPVTEPVIDEISFLEPSPKHAKEEPDVEIEPFEEKATEDMGVEEIAEEINPDKLREFLRSTGLTISFSDEQIDQISKNYDDEVIINNVNAVKSIDMSLEGLFEKDISLLYDPELDKKLMTISVFGNTPKELIRYSDIFKKFNFDQLNDSINAIKINAKVDLRKLSTIMFLIGAPSFIEVQNILNENNIVLDEKSLARYCTLMSYVDPKMFEENLKIAMKHDPELKGPGGKPALNILAVETDKLTAMIEDNVKNGKNPFQCNNDVTVKKNNDIEVSDIEQISVVDPGFDDFLILDSYLNTVEDILTEEGINKEAVIKNYKKVDKTLGEENALIEAILNNYKGDKENLRNLLNERLSSNKQVEVTK